MRVVEIPVGAIGIDCLTPLDYSTATMLAAYELPGTRSHMLFVTRYLENLTQNELVAILATRVLGLRLVSESRAPGWLPSGMVGQADGLRAASKARALLIPLSADLWCDLETPGGTANELVDYCNGWCSVVRAAGYNPRAYVGAGLALSPDALYALSFNGYWRSLSNAQRVATCDYMMYQLYPTQTLALPTGSLQADLDVAQKDKHDRSATMIVG